MKKHPIPSTAAAVLAGLLVSAPISALAADTILRFESIQPGSSTGQFGLAWSQSVEKGTPYKVQVSTGKPVTKTALMGGERKIELFFVSPGIVHAMKTADLMYKKVPNAKEAAANLRGIINFPIGAYHYIVYASSPIKSFADVKGKKLFLGPPGGASAAAEFRSDRGRDGPQGQRRLHDDAL